MCACVCELDVCVHVYVNYTCNCVRTRCVCVCKNTNIHAARITHCRCNHPQAQGALSLAGEIQYTCTVFVCFASLPLDIKFGWPNKEPHTSCSPEYRVPSTHTSERVFDVCKISSWIQHCRKGVCVCVCVCL